MAIEAAFDVSGEWFPLTCVFEEFPDAMVELDRIVPTNGETIPYFWLRGPNVASFDPDAVSHPDLGAISVVETVGEEALMRVEWDPDRKTLLTMLLESPVVLVSAVGTRRRWSVEIRGDDREALAAFQSACREAGIPIDLTRLQPLSSPRADESDVLTPPQREALLLAYEHGYFDSPRRITQTELAAELDITRQSVSSRLQRGLRRLVGTTMFD
ncbi:bacterio-opsin activator HTH domain-containing protein [Natronococcus amylolyticus DSM 10524]|uniref:Bacterio-opsin activator HTH domain-containing protein n=1 Tax=Natronococcus amylolyticus DSM 10524 TaxID=1227497 RepID=L9XIP0_9EURY|nr:helix-turn-helix domain-containing protein [Natronococcus amylolyticus]ELY61477.1 bacterio-opsin activator HTH domain-containing protein [Natronococcus amylolyticus DSM 10524]